MAENRLATCTGKRAEVTALWKDNHMDPILFSIFPNNVEGETHSVLIKFDKDAELFSRVNLEGLETW